MKYSIIIPAYKEARYIGRTLDALYVYLKEQKMLNRTEVIVVAADAGDNTATVARNEALDYPHFRVIEFPSRVGKGRDVRAGFLEAKGNYRLFMDADMATPLHHIGEAFSQLEAGADVVYGVRNLSLMHNTFSRKLSSRLSNLAIRLLAARGVADSQCGFKAFTSESADLIFKRSRINGWGIDIEMLTIARLHKLQIQPLSVPDWKDPKGDDGLAGDSQFQAMVQTFKELLSIVVHRIRGRYS